MLISCGPCGVGIMSERTSRSLAFAVYRPLSFFRNADAAFLITVRGDTLVSRAALRSEMPSARILATTSVTFGAVGSDTRCFNVFLLGRGCSFGGNRLLCFLDFIGSDI